MLCRMWMHLYRLGARTARECLDEGACREHVAATTEQPMTFGLFDERVRQDYVYWNIKLREIARDVKVHKAWWDYEIAVGHYGSNYLSVALPIAQDFYNLGLMDYFDKGEVCDVEDLYRESPYRLMTDRGVRSLKPTDVLQMAQAMCYKRMDLDTAFVQKYALPQRYYDLFIRKIGHVSRYGYKYTSFA